MDYFTKIELGGLILEYYPKSFLRKHGWFKSFRNEMAVDANNCAIPWLTYSSIHFIEMKLKSHFRVFEYGCGNSTLWYANRVSEVIAVENDINWIKNIQRFLPSNGKLIYLSEPEKYACEVINHDKFHVISIDGLARDTCLSYAIQSLTPDGVIIWDNSERDDFKMVSPLLQSEGFREIPFYGMTPISFVSSQTSILYRSLNCFEI